MYKILMPAVIAVLVVLSLLNDARLNRRREAALAAIAVAPLPGLPLSFRWNWWSLGAFMAAPVVILALSLYVRAYIGATLIVPGFLAACASAYYVGSYLRFAVTGPAFILEAEGIAFAGTYLRWRDVSAIDYVPSGRTPRIRFRQTDRATKGFNVLDQFYGKTSIATCFIADPDSLVGWSRRLQSEDLGKRGAIQNTISQGRGQV